MLFNSPTFLAFFVVVLAGHWLLRNTRHRNILLLIASYVFYSAWSPKFLALILFSTVVDFVCGHYIGVSETQKRKRGFLLTSLIVNLGLLAVFKYSNFFVAEMAALLEAIGLQPNIPVLSIVLPVGISFYTFQSLSYTIDIYRGKLKPINNFLDFALFVALFPQLVAGPIERAMHMLPQIQSDRVWDAKRATQGLQLIFWGLFIKMAIADNLAPYVDRVYGDPTEYSGRALISATIFFAIQIYCDFAGYTNVARGTAKMLGFELVKNFQFPYLSRSPVEFWQRWHISLSKWFQDYLYFPMAMHYARKGGVLSKYKAHVYAMTLIGFWHGASWTFVAFGVYWGLVIVIYLVFKQMLDDRAARLDRPESAGPNAAQRLVQTIAMFAVACVAYMMFRSPSIGEFWYIFTHVGSSVGKPSVVDVGVMQEWILWLMCGGLMLAEWLYVKSEDFRSILQNPPVRFVGRYAMAVAVVLAFIVAQHGVGRPFIYFQF